MHDTAIPHLRPLGSSKQLVVHEKPFLIRGVEVHNSSFSSAKHMRPIWQTLADMHANTVLGSVSWEMIEPEEHQFDFDELDRIVLAARQHGLKLVLLWFGAWKNGFSNYVPSWIKLDPLGFPRQEIRVSEGADEKQQERKILEVVSPLHRPILDAETLAFKALMQHLKALDGDHHTVLMVQVENEPGLLGDSRDYSDHATSVFNQCVPEDLVAFLTKQWNSLHPDMQSNLNKAWKAHDGTQRDLLSWPALFGKSPHTDEMFQAYHYAKHIEQIAQAGKSVYPLPMYTNFWLNYRADPMEEDYPVLAGGGDQPGDYPSGGAVSTVLDIWRGFAPSLDFLAPDVYFNPYDKVCRTYRHGGQPLFIPEQRRDEYGARRLWQAIGSYQALGISPFGIDSLADGEQCAYTKHYQLLEAVSDIVLAHQSNDPPSMQGFYFDPLIADEKGQSPSHTFEIANYRVRIERAFVCGKPGPGYGLVIHLGPGPHPHTARFLLVGAGFHAIFESLDPKSYTTGILSFEEKERDPSSGKLVTRRRLNGDETRSGSLAIMPNEEPDYNGFPIPITIPALTRIAECTVYSLMNQ